MSAREGAEKSQGLPAWYTLEHALEDGYASVQEACRDPYGPGFGSAVQPRDYEAPPGRTPNGRTPEQVQADYDNWNSAD